ncbi:membrane dipeptidase [Maribacter sp. 2-571]|uniref:membrane dipeptidase n=1 Tax=Maribacter sp. 2-571 TaxID=3417569 RepID=UPI003D34B7B2
MSKKNRYIDLHCHPALKPFGKSFDSSKTQKRNSPNRMRKNSIYHRKGVTPLRKKINNLLTLTKFTQADLTSVHRGELRILVVSLYPLEKKMVMNRDGVSGFGKLLRNLTTGIGLKRIEHLQKMKDYFTDLEDEYHFYEALDNIPVTVDRKKVRYKMVASFKEIEEWEEDDIPTVFIIISIEGCHVFNTGLQLAGREKADPVEVLANIEKVKKWRYPPFFVGLAHHFENELCGHAKSMGGLVARVLKQIVDETKGITPLGTKVIDALLETDRGPRIFIDLKHMNVTSRYEYYEYIKERYNGSIPFIVSHGAVNGINNPIDNNRVDPSFNDATINFYDDEVFRIARSGGIFGIQLDERRIAHKKVMGLLAGRNKSAKLIWLQIEHMATYLDLLGLDAWNIQCLGTDFDGIIDPLPGFWTAKDLDKLPKFLEDHANDFLASERGLQLKPKNKLTAKKIVAKFMFDNAQTFLKKHF